jgi:hypothetical protein
MPDKAGLCCQIEETTLHCGEEERDELLYYILAAHPGRTLIFVNAVSTARRVAALLLLLKLPSAALHAGAASCPLPFIMALRQKGRLSLGRGALSLHCCIRLCVCMARQPGTHGVGPHPV